MADDSVDTVQLTDLEVIQQFSLAVRGATATRAEVIAALEADLAFLRSAPAARAKASPPAAKAPTETTATKTPTKTAAAKTAATKAPATKARATKAPATKATRTRA